MLFVASRRVLSLLYPHNMACCNCLDGPAPAGVDDMDKPGSVPIKVRLSTGLEVRVHVLPSDTIARVNQKVEHVHGVQPDVVIQGNLVHPPLCARHEKKWLPVRDDVTMAQLGMQQMLKYADITDQLDRIKKLADVHWATSDAFAFGIGISK